MNDNVVREAKVSLLLDISNALRSVDTLQKKLDGLSIKNIQAQQNADPLANVSKGAEKATKKIQTLKQEFDKAKKEFEKLLFDNRMNVGFTSSETYLNAKKNLEDLAVQLKWQKEMFKNLDGSVSQARANKERVESLKQAAKLQADINKSLKEASGESMRKEMQATNTLLNYQTEQKKAQKKYAEDALSVAQKEEKVIQKIAEANTKKAQKNKDEFTNYSSALSKLENQAARIYRELNNPTMTTKHAELRTELERITNEYAKLNRESVKFRQLIGIQSSRGFYDLNHSLDYFRAKLRSRLVYSFATEVDNLAMEAPRQFMNAMSTYQQNKVNFAQVLPENLANNQAVMNNAMKEFTQIAADYGTAVNEVVEAGRLWGRQYKDVSIVQELVRNSTKLSITDNMSLTEVNKGLEATMQQYNIHLKDANEAQQVSGKIVDTWAKLADNAVVTAQDLANANERSAGAAYQAGVGFDYLQAMIATMSAATGKAGGEVGRSIRSMLVSMRSAKAEKEFAKLGIATKELVNGEVRVRSFEKVITDLMKKLQTTPKDVSNVILAMSGGKFQYTNVMALLKNYEQMMKNLEVARNSQGWADEQVGRQYQTISRQVKALTADLQQMIRVLDESGMSNGISNLIQDLRYFVQLLQGITPAMMNVITTSAKWFVYFKTLSVIINTLNGYIKNTNGYMSSFRGIFTAYTGNVIKGTTAMKMFGAAILGNIGNILTLIPLLVTLAGLINGIHEDRNSKYYANQVIEKSSKDIEALNEFINKYKEYQRIMNDGTAGDTAKKTITEQLIKAQEELRDIVGEEAYQRIKASEDVVGAIEAEIQAIKIAQSAKSKEAVAWKESEIEKTKVQLEQSLERLKIDKDEFEANKQLILDRLEMMKASGMDSEWAKHLFGITSLEEANEDLDTSIEQQTAKISEYRAKISRLQGEIAKINGDYNNNGIVGSTGGTTENTDGTGGKGNYAEQARRNQLERERNQLWYQGKIEAQAYENALQSITNLEQLYGTTTYSITQRGSLYANRLKDLEAYKTKLEAFRNQLLQSLDNEMATNQKVAQIVGYKTNMTIEEKLQNFEVNKELYQQEKTYSSIVNLVTALSSKIEETNGKIISATGNIQAQEEELMKQKIADINEEYQLRDTMLNRPTNYNYETQKIKLQIEQEQALIKQQEIKIEQLNAKRRIAQENNNALEIQSLNKKIQTETLILEEHYQRLAELENQKNYSIRNGLAEITTSFLIEGNSLKDIWKRLWQDLAREAIQRLFQVKATASLLGSLFGLFGGGGSSQVSEFDAMGGFTSAYGIKYHTGANVGTYPKMHSGGLVEQGRIGVVPKLQSNEVIRTLQVGEEVNSLQDRRSNEMLAAIVLKALDGQNARPNNFNIMALDSKSFAEYLNDNADVLTAVLAKQGALGRR